MRKDTIRRANVSAALLLCEDALEKLAELNNAMAKLRARTYNHATWWAEMELLLYVVAQQLSNLSPSSSNLAAGNMIRTVETSWTQLSESFLRYQKQITNLQDFYPVSLTCLEPSSNPFALHESRRPIFVSEMEDSEREAICLVSALKSFSKQIEDSKVILESLRMMAPQSPRYRHPLIDIHNQIPSKVKLVCLDAAKYLDNLRLLVHAVIQALDDTHVSVRLQRIWDETEHLTGQVHTLAHTHKTLRRLFIIQKTAVLESISPKPMAVTYQKKRIRTARGFSYESGSSMSSSGSSWTDSDVEIEAMLINLDLSLDAIERSLQALVNFWENRRDAFPTIVDIDIESGSGSEADREAVQYALRERDEAKDTWKMYSRAIMLCITSLKISCEHMSALSWSTPPYSAARGSFPIDQGNGQGSWY